MGSWCGGSVYRQVTNSLQLQRPPSQNDASSCEQRLCGRVPDLGGGADPVHPPLGGMAALQPPAVGRRCAAIDPVRALPPSSQYCPTPPTSAFAQTDKQSPCRNDVAVSHRSCLLFSWAADTASQRRGSQHATSMTRTHAHTHTLHTTTHNAHIFASPLLTSSTLLT